MQKRWIFKHAGFLIVKCPISMLPKGKTKFFTSYTKGIWLHKWGVGWGLSHQGSNVYVLTPIQFCYVLNVLVFLYEPLQGNVNPDAEIWICHKIDSADTVLGELLIDWQLLLLGLNYRKLVDGSLDSL